MIRVYVAGAYSADNVLGVLSNMKKGIELSTKVMLAGFAPFCPWLDYHYALIAGDVLDVNAYQEVSKAWLEVSDAMILVEGWEDSKGTQKEIKLANDLLIPIYFTLGTLIRDYFKVGD